MGLAFVVACAILSMFCWWLSSRFPRLVDLSLVSVAQLLARSWRRCYVSVDYPHWCVTSLCLSHPLARHVAPLTLRMHLFMACGFQILKYGRDGAVFPTLASRAQAAELEADVLSSRGRWLARRERRRWLRPCHLGPVSTAFVSLESRVYVTVHVVVAVPSIRCPSELAN